MPTTNSKTSSAFLTLPRELRDIIYTSLLDESRPAPRDPDHAGPRLRLGSRRIFYEFGSPKPALLQLKLVSKQTYAEVHDLLVQHDQQDDSNANMDIMISGSSIWPTWTKLPVTAHLFPIVQVNVRWYWPAEAPG